MGNEVNHNVIYECEDPIQYMEESSLHDTVAQEVDIASPLVSTTMSRADDILDSLCDSFTHSLPHNNAGTFQNCLHMIF